MLNNNNNKGFTLVEMVVAMAIFMIVLGLTSSAFIIIVRSVSTQSRQAQSNVEGVIGLELLRTDIVSAGYGLPWNPDTLAYLEADATPPQNAYNQVSGAPRSVQSGDNAPSTSDPALQLPGTDYLVIRATSLATNAAAQRWTYMTQQMSFTDSMDTSPNTILARYGQPIDNFDDTDRVTVLTGTASSDPSNQRSLVTSIATTFSNRGDFAPPIPNLPTPPHPLKVDSEPYFIYGIKEAGSPVVEPRMPHNRADYYVRIPTGGINRMSQRCAPNTGILFKGLVSHNKGSIPSELPLLDCVADFQVVFDIDPLNNGSIVTGDAATSLRDPTTLNLLDANQIRNQLKNIQVYILTHDGKRDNDYTYPNADAPDPTIGVGPGNGITSTSGHTFHFNTIGAGWEHYRWRVYKMVLSPKNLLQDQK